MIYYQQFLFLSLSLLYYNIISLSLINDINFLVHLIF